MNEPAINRWVGKSAEDVLAESLHQLRAPIHTLTGSLSVLKSFDKLSAEQVQQMIDLALQSALHARDVINSLDQYMSEKQKD
jgi:signal transduction histidine kinase